MVLRILILLERWESRSLVTVLPRGTRVGKLAPLGPHTLAVMPHKLYVATRFPSTVSPSILLAKTETRSRPNGQALIADDRPSLESLREMCKVASKLTHRQTLLTGTTWCPNCRTSVTLLPTPILKPVS